VTDAERYRASGRYLIQRWAAWADVPHVVLIENRIRFAITGCILGISWTRHSRLPPDYSR